MSEVKLASGAMLVVGLARWDAANALKKAILRAVRDVEVPDVDPKKGIDAGFRSALYSKVLDLAASDEVEAAFFKCAEASTYESLKITPELFDDPKLGEQARRDFNEIMLRVAEANTSHFFGNAFSELSTLLGKNGAAPGSSQTQTTP